MIEEEKPKDITEETLSSISAIMDGGYKLGEYIMGVDISKVPDSDVTVLAIWKPRDENPDCLEVVECVKLMDWHKWDFEKRREELETMAKKYLKLSDEKRGEALW